MRRRKARERKGWAGRRLSIFEVELAAAYWFGNVKMGGER